METKYEVKLSSEDKDFYHFTLDSFIIDKTLLDSLKKNKVKRASLYFDDESQKITFDISFKGVEINEKL